MTDAPDSTDGRAPRLRDGLWIAAGAFVVYRLLAQQAFYGGDGCFFVHCASYGCFENHVHYLYLPLLWLWKQVVAPLGLSWFEAASVLSSFGMAGAAFFTHRSFAVLGLTRARAAWGAALLALAPGVMFFASVVDKHGIGCMFDAIACWLAARLVRRPSAANAVLLGTSVGVAFLVRSFGALLPAVLLPAFLALRWEAGGLRDRASELRALALCAIVAGLDLAIVAAGPPALVALGLARDEASSTGLLEYVLARASATEDVVVACALSAWNEWLVGFAPVSTLWLAGWLRRELRPLALALTAALLLAYVPLTSMILNGVVVGYGSYFMPPMWLAALIVARAFRPAWLAIVLAVSFGFGAYTIRTHEAISRTGEMAAGFDVIAGDERVFLFADGYADLEMVFVHCPEVPYFPMSGLGGMPDEGAAGGVQGMRDTLRELFDQGYTVLLTAQAVQTLRVRAARNPEGFEALLLEALRTEYEFERRTSGAFEAWRVAPR